MSKLNEFISKNPTFSPDYCKTGKKICWALILFNFGSMNLKKLNERCAKCQN